MGNTSVYRDWGWAPDFVEAIFKINNSKKRNDYIVSTGKSVSLDSVIKKIFLIRKIDEKFYIKNNHRHTRVNEINKIYCDNSKIKREIKWRPKKSINEIIPKIAL